MDDYGRMKNEILCMILMMLFAFPFFTLAGEIHGEQSIRLTKIIRKYCTVRSFDIILITGYMQEIKPNFLL